MVKSFIHEDRLQISDQNVYPKYPEVLCVAIYIFNSSLNKHLFHLWEDSGQIILQLVHNIHKVIGNTASSIKGNKPYFPLEFFFPMMWVLPFLTIIFSPLPLKYDFTKIRKQNLKYK